MDPMTLQALVAMAGSGGGMPGMGGGKKEPDFFQKAANIRPARAGNPFTGGAGTPAIGAEGPPEGVNPNQQMGQDIGSFARKLLASREQGA